MWDNIKDILLLLRFLFENKIDEKQLLKDSWTNKIGHYKNSIFTFPKSKDNSFNFYNVSEITLEETARDTKNSYWVLKIIMKTPYNKNLEFDITTRYELYKIIYSLSNHIRL